LPPVQVPTILQRLGEVPIVDGIKEVIYAVEFESLSRILVIGRGKNNGAAYFHRIKNLKGQPIGQLDVQKDKVRMGIVLEPFNGLVHGWEHGGDLHALLLQ